VANIQNLDLTQISWHSLGPFGRLHARIRRTPWVGKIFLRWTIAVFVIGAAASLSDAGIAFVFPAAAKQLEEMTKKIGLYRGYLYAFGGTGLAWVLFLLLHVYCVFFQSEFSLWRHRLFVAGPTRKIWRTLTALQEAQRKTAGRGYRSRQIRLWISAILSALFFAAAFRLLRANSTVFVLSLVAAIVLMSEGFRLRRPEARKPAKRKRAWLYRGAGALVTIALPLLGTLGLDVGKLPESISVIAALSILAGWGGGIWYFFHKARAALEPKASDAFLSEGRAPIVLCRSFVDDDLLLEQAVERISGDREDKQVATRHLQHGGLVRYEQVMEKQAWNYGPLITVGEPGVIRRGTGALRDHFADHEWQKQVDNWMTDAKFVMVTVNSTPGLRWEIANILAKGHLAKTIFLIPPAKDHAARWRFLAEFPNAPWNGGLNASDARHSLGVYWTDDQGTVILGSEHDWDRDYEIAFHLGIYGVLKTATVLGRVQ
jgi:hypothetical protein